MVDVVLLYCFGFCIFSACEAWGHGTAHQHKELLPATLAGVGTCYYRSVTDAKQA